MARVHEYGEAATIPRLLVLLCECRVTGNREVLSGGRK